MLNDLKTLSKDEQFRRAAAYAGVPEGVLRGMWKVESGEGTNMRSSVGARGHFQVMPDTQRTLEKRSGRAFDPDNFSDAITMAAELLRENLAAAKGDVTTAVRMYHGGWDRSQWGPVNAKYAPSVFAAGGLTAPATASAKTAPAAPATTPRPSLESLIEGGITGKRDKQALIDGGIRGDEHTPTPSIEDILASRTKKKATDTEQLDDVTKGLIEQARATGAVTGEAAEYADAVRAAPEEAVAAVMKPGIAAPSDDETTRSIARDMRQQEEQKELEESRTTLDKWGAHFDIGPAAAMVWALTRDADTDPTYNYAERMDEVETPDMDEHMLSILRTAKSREDEEFLLGRIANMQYSNQIISEEDSTAANLGWGLLAGVSDPVNFAAGVGVGTVLRTAGVGAVAFAKAGRPVASLVSASGEGALGALAADGIIVGMGGHRSGEEVAMDVAGGALLGGLFNSRGAFKVGSNTPDVADTLEQLRLAASDARARHLTIAREQLGEGAPPEAIQERALVVSQEEYRTWVHANLQDVPQRDRLLSDPSAWSTGSPHPEAEVRRIVDQYGLHNRVGNLDEFRYVIDVIANAERIAAANPVDEALRKTVLESLNLASDSTILLGANSPVARAVGALLTESPEGAAGRLRTTASLDRSFRFEQIIGSSSRRLGNAKDLYQAELGLGRFSRIFNANSFETRFNTALTEELLTRYQHGRSTTTSRAIREAADAIDDAHVRSGEMVRVGKLPGWENIPRGGKSGYFGRRWKGSAMRGASAQKVQALREALTDQLVRTAEFDPDFASTLSQKMLARFQQSAVGEARAGGYADISDTVQDALGDMGEAVNKYHERFGTKGLSQLAARLNVDMLASYADGEGGTMRLMDFIEHDQSKLLLSSAQRVSGAATLSKYGLVGPQALRDLKTAMQATGATGKEIAAFERVMADLTGTGHQMGPSLLRDLRLLTSAVRLGSASINQIGTYADALHSLPGVQVADAVGALPRLRKEALALANGESVENSILGQMEVGLSSPFGMSQYWDQGWGALDQYDLMATAESAGILSKVVRGAANAVHTMNGQRLLIAAQTRGFAEQITMKALRFVREGGEDKALADMGITPALAERLRAAARDMPDVAKFDERGVLSEFNPDLALNTQYEGDMIALRNAIMRGTGQIMNHAFVGERGKWASNELMLFLMQFRTVSLVAQQKTLGRLVGVHGIQKVALLQAAGMSLTMPLHAARVGLRASLLPDDEREEYLDKHLTLASSARASMNYLTTVGLAADALDLSGAFLQGWAGDALPTWMQPTGGRGGGFRGNLIGGHLAPGVGVVEDAAAVLTGNWKKARNALPGASLPYVQPWLLGGTERLDDLLDE